MAIESALRNTSRRALLAGLAGGLAAGVAGALGRASPALATHGDVHLGASNDATSLTTVHNTTDGFNAFSGEATGVGTGVAGISGSGAGVYGLSISGYGVVGDSTSKTGVYGVSSSGTGVSAISGSSYGVYAYSNSGSTPAAAGESFGGNTGLQGYSGTSGPPASPAKTGVFGYAAQDASARGVTGETTAGRGVQGIATSGVGVHASAGASGTALEAAGRVVFSTAGLTSVAVGTKSKTVSPGTDLVVGSKILCTLESNQAGLLIQRLTKDTAANTFTVFVSAKVLAGKYAKVAWFVIG